VLLDELWAEDPFLKSFIGQVEHKPGGSSKSRLLLFRCPKPPTPQELTLRQAEAAVLIASAVKSGGGKALLAAAADSKALAAASALQQAREAEADADVAATMASSRLPCVKRPR
jgi:hypothetical protein